MTSRPQVATVCPQCGTSGTGNYCATCGDSLAPDKESVSEEVRSKATSPLIAALSFIKTIWLTWVKPVAFLRSCFTGVPPLSSLSFPLSSLWRVADKGRQKVMRPFQCLAIAIFLVAVLGSLERAAWGVRDVGERMFGLSIADAREQAEAQLKSNYEATYGRTLHFVDSAHLTGVEVLDKPLDEILGLLNYAYFGLVAVLVLAHRRIKRHQALHAYVYIISAAITASAAMSAVGLAVFSLGATTGSVSTLALSGFGQVAGYLLVLYFVAILPIVVLPKVLDVSGARVVLATCVAAVAWLAGRYLFFSVLQWQLGFVWR